MNDFNGNNTRLFLGSRIAIATTAARFVAVSAVLLPLKNSFGLDNGQVGWIGGAGLWGFTITMLTFGSLCDVLGMKLLLRLAVISHLAGAAAMLLADGFVMLFAGSLLLSMGDGLVQAACNPLVVTIYPDRKTEMINKLHLWFPAGIVIGSLLAFALNATFPGAWRFKLVMVIVPAVLYGAVFIGQSFPRTERVQLGVSFGQMFRETFFSPLFLLLALCMMMTASVELGPNTWLAPILESAGIPGILVLAWISLLMALLRQFAGPMARHLGSSGILFCSAVLSGLGLLWLSNVNSFITALAAGSVFAIGVAYFWPTMIGTTSERVAKGGALALAVIGGVGQLTVGLITVPMMGAVADSQIHRNLPDQETVNCIKQITAEYQQLLDSEHGTKLQDISQAAMLAKEVLAIHTADGILPEPMTTKALRAAIAAAPDSKAAHAAKQLIGPAENAAGRVAFRKVAFLSIILAVIFGCLAIHDRIRGKGAIAVNAS